MDETSDDSEANVDLLQDDGIAADFEILEAIGAHVDDAFEQFVSHGALQKTMRRWLNGHGDQPEDRRARACITFLAIDLEMFTPSPSGRTALDRYLRAQVPDTDEERQALAALGAAQFHLVRIVDRETPELVRLDDLVTGESMLLLDERISALAQGIPTAMRLCPLESGRYVLISPLFALDENLLDKAMTFVRNGRPLGTGHRCAASLYREVARRGFRPVPQETDDLDFDDLDPDDLSDELASDLLEAAKQHLSPVQQMALRWLRTGDDDADLIADVAALASVDNLADAMESFVLAKNDDDTPEELIAAFDWVAAVQATTLARRAQAGMPGAAEIFDQAKTLIIRYFVQNNPELNADDVLDHLQTLGNPLKAIAPAESAAAGDGEIE